MEAGARGGAALRSRAYQLPVERAGLGSLATGNVILERRGGLASDRVVGKIVGGLVPPENRVGLVSMSVSSVSSARVARRGKAVRVLNAGRAAADARGAGTGIGWRLAEGASRRYLARLKDTSLTTIRGFGKPKHVRDGFELNLGSIHLNPLLKGPRC